MGGDRDAAGGDDPLDGLADGQASRDDLSDTVSEDVARSRRDFDSGDHEEVPADRLRRLSDCARRIVVGDCDPRQARPLPEGNEFLRRYTRIGRMAGGGGKGEEHGGGREKGALALKLLRWSGSRTGFLNAHHSSSVRGGAPHRERTEFSLDDQGSA